MSAVRISKVRFKGSGVEFRVHEGGRLSNPSMELLHDRMSEIRSGEVMGLAFVALHSDGSVGAGWCKGFGETVFEGLGAIENLRTRFWFDAIGGYDEW